MAFDIKAIKEKLNALSQTKKASSDKPKINWWKATPGEHVVRFLPLYSADGTRHSQPFFEVVYYDHKELAERRFPSPSQYGLEDPIKDAAFLLGKDKSREGWLRSKKLQPKERYYAAIIVRGEAEEAKGVQVWELSPKLCKDIYALLVSDDYSQEDMFSVDKGFDFAVSVTPTDKTFNGYQINDIKMIPKRKESKLFSDKAKIEAVQKQVPDFENFFKSQLKTTEEMHEIVANFLMLQSDDAVGEQTAQGTSRGGSADNAKIAADVNDAFADLENS